MKRNCLIGIIGRDEYYKTWFSENPDYDIILMIYNDLQIPKEYQDKCKAIYRRRGLSGSLLKWLFENELIIQNYDYYWIPNDDVTIYADDINLLFCYMKEYQLTIASPSLLKDESNINSAGISYCHGVGVRYVPATESICDCYESQFLETVLKYFGINKSAWGIALLISKIANDENRKIAIFDYILTKHNGVQNEIKQGTMMEYLIKNNINADKEYKDLIERYNLHEFKKYVEEFEMENRKNII
jgi:hypothetical protein